MAIRAVKLTQPSIVSTRRITSNQHSEQYSGIKHQRGKMEHFKIHSMRKKNVRKHEFRPRMNPILSGKKRAEVNI